MNVAALVVTVVVEVLLAWLLAGVLAVSGRRRFLVVVAALNLLTHPLALLWAGDDTVRFVAVEVGVFLVEAAGMWRLQPLSLGRACGFALLANLVTALLSFVIPAGFWIR